MEAVAHRLEHSRTPPANVRERATIAGRSRRRNGCGWPSPALRHLLRTPKCAISKRGKSRSFGSLCVSGSPASRRGRISTGSSFRSRRSVNGRSSLFYFWSPAASGTSSICAAAARRRNERGWRSPRQKRCSPGPRDRPARSGRAPTRPRRAIFCATRTSRSPAHATTRPSAWPSSPSRIPGGPSAAPAPANRATPRSSSSRETCRCSAPAAPRSSRRGSASRSSTATS